MKLCHRCFVIILPVILLLIPAFVNAQEQNFGRNPTRAFLATAAEDLKNGTFSAKYNITVDSFISILAYCSSFDKYEDFRGYEITIDSTIYYLDTAYFKDAQGVFRSKPGDCGFSPGTILFDPLPGREAEALAYLKAHDYLLKSFDSSSLSRYSDTTSDDYRSLLKAITEKYYYILGSGTDAYFVRAVGVSPFMEEQEMAVLASSGLFRLLSREAVPCGGYYSRLMLKQKYVFGQEQPSRSKGTAFFRNYLVSSLNKSIIVEITPVSDFSYSISFTGPSPYLALKRNNMWERYCFSVVLQRGFECKSDEMELYFSFKDAAFAMGAPSDVPPEPRFKSVIDEEGYSYQNRAKDYMRIFIGKMADLYEGSRLNGF